MLQVDYKNEYGTCTLTHTEWQSEQYKYTIHLCRANCLCAFIYFYKEEDGTEMAQLVNFFDDIQHAQKYLKDGIFGSEWDKYDDFHFNAKELNAAMWKLIREIANCGCKITIE